MKIVHNHLRKINRMAGPQSTTNSSQQHQQDEFYDEESESVVDGGVPQSSSDSTMSLQSSSQVPDSVNTIAMWKVMGKFKPFLNNN